MFTISDEATSIKAIVANTWDDNPFGLEAIKSNSASRKKSLLSRVNEQYHGILYDCLYGEETEYKPILIKMINDHAIFTMTRLMAETISSLGVCPLTLCAMSIMKRDKIYLYNKERNRSITLEDSRKMRQYNSSPSIDVEIGSEIYFAEQGDGCFIIRMKNEMPDSLLHSIKGKLLSEFLSHPVLDKHELHISDFHIQVQEPRQIYLSMIERHSQIEAAELYNIPVCTSPES
jgi:hypothetical protein